MLLRRRIVLFEGAEGAAVSQKHICVTPKFSHRFKYAKSRRTAITVLAMLKEKHSEEQHLQQIDESSSDCRMAARSLLYVRIPDE